MVIGKAGGAIKNIRFEAKDQPTRRSTAGFFARTAPVLGPTSIPGAFGHFGTIHGGRFWPITPMVNWYPLETVRLKFGYGYGALARFGVNGGTQFFQTRAAAAFKEIPEALISSGETL